MTPVRMDGRVVCSLAEQMQVARRRYRPHPAQLLAVTLAIAASCSSPTAPRMPTVTSVVVTGLPTIAIFVGDTYQLVATANLSDGSAQVVTNTASWSSSNTLVAQISSSGLLTAVATGSATARATYQGQSGSETASVEPGTSGLMCGIERWPVKTLSDPSATSVDMSVAPTTTIAALNQFTAHCSGIPSLRTYPEEFKTFEVTGRILVVRSEDDHDYHIALQDLNDPSVTIVTEIADPSCEGSVTSPFRQLLGQTRNAFNAIIGGRALSAMVGETLKVRGVGFYDFNHGQTGRSQSCLEIHPVISVERVQ